MWGEGASNLWVRLEEEDEERDLELLDAVRSRLRAGATDTAEDEQAAAGADLDLRSLIW